MIGYDTVNNYLRILRSLIYINRKPAYYLNRVFKLSCSQLGDRFRSAEFTLTLTVLHPKQPTITPLPVTTEKPAIPAHEHDSSNMFAHVLLHSQEANEPHARTSHMQRVSGVTHSTMLIIVICGSFVLLICGVGLARLRNQTHVPKSKKGHQACAKVLTKIFGEFLRNFLNEIFFRILWISSSTGTIQHSQLQSIPCRMII